MDQMKVSEGPLISSQWPSGRGSELGLLNREVRRTDSIARQLPVLQTSKPFIGFLPRPYSRGY